MMEFGVTYTADKNFTDVLWGVKRAEELGFSFVGIPDTPYQSMDVYPYLAACALQTSRIKLGPYITNPLTRHPSITASAMATIQVMSSGRAFLAMGRGNSAVKQLGWKPASWKQYRRAVPDIRRWMRGEAVDVEGSPVPLRLEFTEGEIPISLGVWGPRGAQVAGELADCATTECAEVGAVAWFADKTQKAAQAAGRGPLDFEVSSATFVSDDIHKAREICRWEPDILTSLLWGLVQTCPPEELPASLMKGFETLIENKPSWQQYDWDGHRIDIVGFEAAMADEGHRKLLTDEMVDRFCVLGSVEACVEKLRELESVGVNRFCAYLFGLDREELDRQLRAYAERIMPHFQ